MLLDNTPDYLFTLFGAALAGAAVVGINSTRRGAELAADIRHTDCRLVVTDAALAPLLDGLDLGGAPVVRVDEGDWPGPVRVPTPRSSSPTPTRRSPPGPRGPTTCSC